MPPVSQSPRKRSPIQVTQQSQLRERWTFSEPSFTYFFTSEKKSLTTGPQMLASVPYYVQELSVNQPSPQMSTGACEPQIQSSPDSKIAI